MTVQRELPRFPWAVRAVHWSVGLLMLLCIATAAVLYNPTLAIPIGHRHAVELIHVWCGFALPVPLLVGLACRAFRADLRRLNRFSDADRRWLRSRTRRDGTIRVGKFNAGQKVNSWLTAGSIAVLFGSGVLMYFVGLAPLTWRTGATFVHDWVALAIGLLVFGHIAFAWRDAEARRGMRTGRVSREWAVAEHAAWAAELGAVSGEAGGAPQQRPIG